MNFPEQLAAEWYSYNEYCVQTNVKLGPLERGGYEAKYGLTLDDLWFMGFGLCIPKVNRSATPSLRQRFYHVRGNRHTLDCIGRTGQDKGDFGNRRAADNRSKADVCPQTSKAPLHKQLPTASNTFPPESNSRKCLGKTAVRSHYCLSKVAELCCSHSQERHQCSAPD